MPITINIEVKMVKLIQEALKEIKRGSSEIIDIERIKILLKNYYENGQNYFIKAGFDPTAPDLHLGHTVLMQKLAIFQQYGGIVQFLIGDFTASIGDPTGKNQTRKILNQTEIKENAKSYETQLFKILDKNKTEIFFNSKWLNKLGTAGILKLSSNLTVARILERDDFNKRYISQTPIAVSEFIYPLLQGYDSVALNSDIEIGGTDQKFNLLMGRTLQKVYDNNKQQAIIMMPILEGTDGKQKMSKSLNNYIGITDKPNDIFGKILSISDDLMWRYFELLSSKSLKDINILKEDVQNRKMHPKKVKESLAIEIVDRFYGKGSGTKAKEEFEKIFVKKDIPNDILEYILKDKTNICQALVSTNLVKSTSQARRDIKANAVSLNNQKIIDEKLNLDIGEYILQKGKKSFAKIIIKGKF
jgi:tyrosyl-tRNA synthetase